MYADGVETPSHEATHKVVKQFNDAGVAVICAE
jgi:hypothetical protein